MHTITIIKLKAILNLKYAGNETEFWNEPRTISGWTAHAWINISCCCFFPVMVEKRTKKIDKDIYVQIKRKGMMKEKLLALTCTYIHGENIWLGADSVVCRRTQSARSQTHTHTWEGLINSFFFSLLFRLQFLVHFSLEARRILVIFVCLGLFTGVCFRFLICGPLSQFSLLYFRVSSRCLDLDDFCIHSVGLCILGSMPFTHICMPTMKNEESINDGIKIAGRLFEHRHHPKCFSSSHLFHCWLAENENTVHTHTHTANDKIGNEGEFATM